MKCELCNRQSSNTYCHLCLSSYRRYVNRIKFISLLGGKCVRCGYDDISGLDFHHIDPSSKEKGVSYLLGRSKQVAEQEIKKCILLCSNCHRKEHYIDKQRLLDYFNNKTFDINRVYVGRKSCGYYPRLKNRKVNRPSKEELEKLVWSKPTIHLANDFGVTDQVIAKWCKSYNTEKPPRGYWAKAKTL